MTETLTARLEGFQHDTVHPDLRERACRGDTLEDGLRGRGAALLGEADDVVAHLDGGGDGAVEIGAGDGEFRSTSRKGGRSVALLGGHDGAANLQGEAAGHGRGGRVRLHGVLALGGNETHDGVGVTPAVGGVVLLQGLDGAFLDEDAWAGLVLHGDDAHGEEALHHTVVVSEGQRNALLDEDSHGELVGVLASQFVDDLTALNLGLQVGAFVGGQHHRAFHRLQNLTPGAGRRKGVATPAEIFHTAFSKVYIHNVFPFFWLLVNG